MLARIATSSRRSPATLRRPPAGQTPSAGWTRLRRARRNCASADASVTEVDPLSFHTSASALRPLELRITCFASITSGLQDGAGAAFRSASLGSMEQSKEVFVPRAQTRWPRRIVATLSIAAEFISDSNHIDFQQLSFESQILPRLLNGSMNSHRPGNELARLELSSADLAGLTSRVVCFSAAN